MLVDVKGKVKNITLSPNDRLIPLLEAVVNSIQATRPGSSSALTVTAYRNNLSLSTVDHEINIIPIESFKIEDSGVGFTPENYDSFKKAESTFKSSLGCKGIGRFTWLKAFKEVEINSVYVNGSEKKRINFNFSLDDAEFLNEVITDESADEAITTTVFLKDIQSPYAEKLPTDLEIISNEIIEHCIIYFLEGKISSFLVKDNCGGAVDLLKVFKENYFHEISKISYKIGSNDFDAYFLKNLKVRKQKQHKVNFCADSRAVINFNLKEFKTGLPSVFEDKNGEQFNYSIFLSSPYLNRNVNQERTSFSISLKDDLSLEDFPSVYTIIIELVLNSASLFDIYVEPAMIMHREKIKHYINTTGYMYRHLLKNRPKWIDELPFNLSDEKLDIELHKLSRNYELELKTEAARLKKELKESEVYNIEAYKKALEKYTQDLNEVGKSNLAKYIVHRKSVIDAFEMSMDLQSNDKHALENAVHDIIMPIRSTSDEVKDHNLWMIDERMSYHQLLVSDKSFKSITDINSIERPDLLIFNNPIVYGDDKKDYTTAIIVEFKRPMRDDYKNDDNPVDQVLEYVMKLRSQNTVFNDAHREIYLDPKIPVYCYVICDLTPTIRNILNLRAFKPLLDNHGYIFYNENINSVIEVLSFDKLIKDAKKRNKILFNMLNLE